MGIGEANVFPCGDQHPPEDEAGVFAGLHHPRQPKQGGIGIGAPQRFDERTDGVEVGVTLFVVEHRPLLDRFLGDGEIDADQTIGVGGGGFDGELQGVEQAAGIAAGHIQQVFAGFLTDCDGAVPIAHLAILQGPIEQLTQVGRLKRLQPEEA